MIRLFLRKDVFKDMDLYCLNTNRNLVTLRLNEQTLSSFFRSYGLDEEGVGTFLSILIKEYIFCTLYQ